MLARPAETPVREKLPFQRLGHFQVIEQIGSGGMGDVYRGYDESLDRYVAIKVLPAGLARDEKFVQRFQAEATAVAKVNHPNVVPIYFIGQDAGHPFFAMQFIEGESLGQRLVREHRLPAEQAVEIVSQCLAGLGAAHDQGLVHRDIKPGNVLLERASGWAMLVDFGLVRRMGDNASMTTTGVIMGTVNYIAPEQARGRTVDARTDIYSLGVLFYQLLSGHLPFLAESPTSMVFQHAYEKPFPLQTAAPTHSAVGGHHRPDDGQGSGRPLSRLCGRDGRSASVSPRKASPCPLAGGTGGEGIAEDFALPAAFGLVSRHSVAASPRPASDDVSDAMCQNNSGVTRHDLSDGRCGRANASIIAIGWRSCWTKPAASRLSCPSRSRRTSAPRLRPTGPTRRLPEHDRHVADTKRREHEENAASLGSQRDLQRHQVEELERQLGKADAARPSFAVSRTC